MPVVIGWTIDRGIVHEERSVIWWGGLVLVGPGAIESGCAALRHRMACTAYMGSAASLRVSLTAAALRLDDDERSRYPAGEVLARETSDTDTVGGLFDAVGHTVAEAISIPVILLALVVIDPLLAATVGRAPHRRGDVALLGRLGPAKRGGPRRHGRDRVAGPGDDGGLQCAPRDRSRGRGRGTLRREVRRATGPGHRSIRHPAASAVTARLESESSSPDLGHPCICAGGASSCEC